ncbi:MAG: aminoglycoside phosphotransferase family protein [Actinomycetales bacterium]|nr:aminoglycoside phosphotransferase family protein [Actinomycetales bacterium]
MADKPVAEVEVSERLVRDLLRAQHPDLADLPLTLVAEGWDNAMWRLGDVLAVRMPRRELAAPLVLHEQQWLTVLAPALSVTVPVPVRTGKPDQGYPWSWSVLPWIEGRHAIELAPADTGPLAEPLATFVASLHHPAPSDAPHNPFRGVPLAERDTILRGRLDALPLAVRTFAERIWADALAAPAWADPPVWLHGDLHPGNLVVSDDGSLAAVVDFGDLCSGDPAVDLAVAWYLFDRPGRERFIGLVSATHAELSPAGTDALWRRARGWALSFATALLTRSDDNPEYLALGERTLAAVLDG